MELEDCQLCCSYVSWLIGLLYIQYMTIQYMFIYDRAPFYARILWPEIKLRCLQISDWISSHSIKTFLAIDQCQDFNYTEILENPLSGKNVCWLSSCTVSPLRYAWWGNNLHRKCSVSLILHIVTEQLCLINHQVLLLRAYIVVTLECWNILIDILSKLKIHMRGKHCSDVLLNINGFI